MKHKQKEGKKDFVTIVRQQEYMLILSIVHVFYILPKPMPLFSQLLDTQSVICPPPHVA